MTPIKPYLIRAVRDWALDSGLTPHIVVDANNGSVKVPAKSVENGRIVLNIHPRAVHEFNLANDWLLFSANFAGQSHVLEIPVAAIRAIYAHENGQGVAFPAESGERTVAEPASADSAHPPVDKGPHLKVVK